MLHFRVQPKRVRHRLSTFASLTLFLIWGVQVVTSDVPAWLQDMMNSGISPTASPTMYLDSSDLLMSQLNGGMSSSRSDPISTTPSPVSTDDSDLLMSQLNGGMSPVSTTPSPVSVYDSDPLMSQLNGGSADDSDPLMSQLNGGMSPVSATPPVSADNSDLLMSQLNGGMSPVSATPSPVSVDDSDLLMSQLNGGMSPVSATPSPVSVDDPDLLMSQLNGGMSPVSATPSPVSVDDSDLLMSQLNGGMSPVSATPSPVSVDDSDLLMSQLNGGMSPVSATPSPVSVDDSDLLMSQITGSAQGEVQGGGLGSGNSLTQCAGGYVTDDLSTYTECEVILGFLAIEGTALVSLQPLSKLKRIVPDSTVGDAPGGNGLIIRANAQLVSTSGLSSLEEVSGGILIEGNSVLQDLDFCLKAVGYNNMRESITVRDNPSLLRQTGNCWIFPVPTALQGGVTYTNNVLLQQIGGFEAVTRVGGHLTISGTSAPAIDTFAGVESVDGDLTISDNPILVNIKMSSLITVGGGLVFSGNRGADALAQTPQLKSVGTTENGDSVQIVRNANLRSIEHLASLQGTLRGAITISANPALATLDGMGHILNLGASTEGISLEISDNPVLSTLSGLSGLQGKIPGAIILELNPNLKVLAGLQGISEIGANINGTALRIRSNAILQSLLGFEGLYELDGALDISNNPELKSLAGMEQLVAIHGLDTLRGYSLSIASNGLLHSLSELAIADKLEGALHLSDNPKIVSLAGLSGIVSVGGLTLDHNKHLVDVSALSTLCAIHGDIRIVGNEQLHSIEELYECLEIDSADSIVIDNVQCLTAAQKGLFESVVDAEIEVEESSVECNTSVTAFINASAADAHVGPLSIEEHSTGQVTVGDGNTRICGGIARPSSSGGEGSTSWSLWHAAGSSGLIVHINTSKCGLQEPQPRYMASVIGDSAHWQLLGVNSVYNATRHGFSLQLWHPVLSGSFMLFYARRFDWAVSWLVDEGQNSGATVPGQSGWREVPGILNALYIDVDTRGSEFGCPMWRDPWLEVDQEAGCQPAFVTSLHGQSGHWRVQGTHAIYDVKPDGFRMFVIHADSLTAQYAEDHEWSVAFLGSTDRVTSGLSSLNWMPYQATNGQDDGYHLYIDVNTSKGAYNIMPSYVTSLSAESQHWMVRGAGSIYEVAKTSFRIYLDKAQPVAFAHAHKWRINYIAYGQPRDCIPEEWGSWGGCTRSCGHHGTRSRSRKIKSPAYSGGKLCTDPEIGLATTESCNREACPVDCSMSDWAQWSGCDVSCASGVRTRSRSIIQQAEAGGLACPTPEELSEQLYCWEGPCPSECEVTEWGPWDQCSVSCSHYTDKNDVSDTMPVEGFRRRRREIIKAQILTNESVCPALEESEACGYDPCPIDCQLSEWSTFGECTVNCSWGVHYRTRDVLVQAAHGGLTCGALNESTACYKGKCPVDCEVTSFSAWSACSVSCGEGWEYRHRSIKSLPNDLGAECPELVGRRQCLRSSCPQDCEATEWSAWSVCSSSCGWGTSSRGRSHIVAPDHGGAGCPLMEDTKACENPVPCPIDCQVDEWTPWSHCSVSCGHTGVRTRIRDIVHIASSGGRDCDETQAEETCTEMNLCPVHCEISEWGEWSECPCGVHGADRTRIRNVTQEPNEVGAVCPELNQSKPCPFAQCPVDCLVGAWASFGECSRSCCAQGKNEIHAETGVETFSCLDPGTQTRTRPILIHPEGGESCESLNSTRICNEQQCPVDCETSEWSTWGNCSTTCGPGTQQRSRAHLRGPEFGGIKCGHLSEIRACNDGNMCPVHCETTDWSSWGSCDASCGGEGRRIRTRSITAEADNGGSSCPTLEDVDTECAGQPCPIDCDLTDWSSWGSCDRSCVIGAGSISLRNRVRTVRLHEAHGGTACPDESQMIDWGICAVPTCPVDCKISEWSDWSICSATCGAGGLRHRTRQILSGPLFGGTSCPTDPRALEQTEKCNNHVFCPVNCRVGNWSEYGACSASCGDDGVHTRRRPILVQAEYGGDECPILNASIPCNRNITCPMDCAVSGWSHFAPIAAGGNTVFRSRSVISESSYGGRACPPLEQNYSLAAGDQCSQPQRGAWSQCDRPCGTGRKHRWVRMTLCSKSAAVAYRYHFMQTQLCALTPCAPGAAEGSPWAAGDPIAVPPPQEVPPLPPIAQHTTSLGHGANIPGEDIELVEALSLDMDIGLHAGVQNDVDKPISGMPALLRGGVRSPKHPQNGAA